MDEWCAVWGKGCECEGPWMSGVQCGGRGVRVRVHG